MKKIYTLVALITVLVVAAHVSPKSLQFQSPLANNITIFDEVTAKLHGRQNTYEVFKKKSLIPQVYAADIIASDVSAYGVIDFDSGEVLSESNLSTPISIASLTKIMTAVVALDLASPDELLTISQNAADKPPTKIAVVAGQKMTVKELLNASLLTSANDATQAIADGIDAKYKEPVFIKAMNEKAKFLKLENSHFTNPMGFDSKQHYSSVHDLAVLSHYAMQYPLIEEIVRKESEHIPANEYHNAFDLPNWNGLLGVYPKAYGMKIGNTDAAKYTTVVLSERNGKKIMAIVLGASDTLSRDLKATQLLDLGYEMTIGLPPVDVTAEQLHAKYSTWSSFFK